MISDNDLYTLSIFLGSLAMLLIILYHFLEVNSTNEEAGSTSEVDEKIGAGNVGAAGGEKIGAGGKQ